MAEYRSKDLALLGHCAGLWKDMIIKRWIWPQEAHKLKSFFVLFCFQKMSQESQGPLRSKLLANQACASILTWTDGPNVLFHLAFRINVTC